MEEYTNQITKISGELWKAFKPRITGDMTKDDFWTDAIKEISDIADQYKGTIGERYATDMAIFYLLQLQNISRKNYNGRHSFTDYLNEIEDGIKKNRS